VATPTKQQRPRRKRTPEEQIARLRSEVSRLRARLKALTKPAPAAGATPVMPPPDADGNYPAAEALRVLLAEQIVRRRQALGWSQKELATRARVRAETVCRLETGKHAPTVTTVDKIDRALKEAGG
jgi:ribosome-binding protein aMBF1 (putative translation factor)